MSEDLKAIIHSRAANANVEYVEAENGNPHLYVAPEDIHPVCKALKEHPQTEFRVLQVISGVDLGEELAVNYVVANFVSNTELIIKTKVKKEEENGPLPELRSVSDIWPAADWQERECFDMVGVKFTNHPDFRRILCPEDWVGYPLRKDYKAEEVYNGMTVYPEDKMNIPDQEFAAKQKAKEKEELAKKKALEAKRKAEEEAKAQAQAQADSADSNDSAPSENAQEEDEKKE